jgi:hypothetical protein
LTGDLRDEVEVLVVMQDDEPGAVGDGGDEQVWDRWCTVVAAIGKDDEDLDSTVFGGRRGVLDWHRDDWRLTQSGVKILRIASRIADLQQRHRRDADEPTFEATVTTKPGA